MQVIMKPTAGCNGTCVYCSSSSTPAKQQMLPRERLGQVFQAFVPWLEAAPRREVCFTWHGGEPMLCGPEYYETVLVEQRRVFAGSLQRVRNNMQSNLTLIDERWVPLLPKLLRTHQVGTSFDIIGGVRGLASGEDLADRWVRVVRLLYEHGVSIGVVYTIHRKSLGRVRDLYYFFRNLAPAQGVRFNPLYREGRGGKSGAEGLWISAAEYGEFLVELCDLWLRDLRRFSIKPLADWYAAWRGGQVVCCDNRGDCHLTHMGIDPDGDIYGCGRASDHGEHRLGNIFENDLGELLERRAEGELASRSAQLQAGPCRDCPYWELCHGGCPMMAYLYWGDLGRECYFCPARKRVYRHFERLLGGRRPATLPESRRAQVHAGC